MAPAALAGAVALSGADWPPAVGEAIGAERAAAALAGFDADIRAAGRLAVQAVHELEAGVKVSGRVYRPAELAAAVRSEGMPGISVGYVSWLGRSGSVSVVSLVLGWDGTVHAAGLPGPGPWPPRPK